MLYLDTALELHGLTIFRDYNTPTRFYYMPRAPRLTTDGGAPAFQLLVYRRDITDNPDFHEGDRPGGGFLTMTVDLGVPAATLTAVKSELASRVPGGGEVDLVAVPFEDGSVRVSALGVSSAQSNGQEPTPGETDRGPRFVEEILGSSKPSLYGDNRAVFQIELSHEGAVLMRRSLESGGTSQVAVVYDLAYRGLMPAYDARITIDFRQSYSYLRSRFTVNTLWFKADIDSEIEKLTKEGHIKIESADYLQSDPAKLAEHATKLVELSKELATWAFFRPGLTPGKVVADDRGNITVHDPTAQALQSQSGGAAAPLAAAGTGRGSPGDVAGPRQQGQSASPATTRVGGQPLPQAQAQPAAEPAQGAVGSSSAVDAWNRMGRPQAAFLLRQLSQEEQQTITFDLRQVAVAQRAAAPQGSIRLLPGWTEQPGRVLDVDLNSPFFEKVGGTVTSTADFAAAGVGSMVVKLRYGVRDDGSSPKDTTEIPIAKSGDKGTYSFFMDKRRGVDLEYQVVVNYTAGFSLGSSASSATSEWISTSTRNLDVDPRVVGAVFPVTLVLGTIDWASVQSIQSTVHHAGGDEHDRTVVLSQAEPTAVVPIRPADDSRDFTVTTTFFYAGAQEVVTTTGSGTSTIVINPPSTRAISVSISAADPLGRFKKVTVELSYPAAAGSPEQTRLVELAGDAQSAAWTFFRPADDASAEYRYRTTLFGRDGTVHTGEWTQTPERQLIVGDVFADIIEVEARFLVPEFTAAGFQGAKLTLEYPDAAPGTDGVEEEFFSGVPQPFTWRVPRPAGAGTAYRYTVQWIRSNGTQLVVGPVTTGEELLMIFPPAEV